MRAREFTNRSVKEFGPALGAAARGVGAAAGVAGQVGKSIAKGMYKSATGKDLDDLSLGGALASALGLKGIGTALQQKKDEKTMPWQTEPPVDKQAAARNIQGKDINLPPLGQVKVKRVTPNDIELDTTKTGLGVPSIKLSSRDLQQKRA